MRFWAKNQGKITTFKATRAQLFSVGEWKTLREPIRSADFQLEYSRVSTKYVYQIVRRIYQNFERQSEVAICKNSFKSPKAEKIEDARKAALNNISIVLCDKKSYIYLSWKKMQMFEYLWHYFMLMESDICTQ